MDLKHIRASLPHVTNFCANLRYDRPKGFGGSQIRLRHTVTDIAVDTGYAEAEFVRSPVEFRSLSTRAPSDSVEEGKERRERRTVMSRLPKKGL